jgi:hypothetical protein
MGTCIEILTDKTKYYTYYAFIYENLFTLGAVLVEDIQ